MNDINQDTKDILCNICDNENIKPKKNKAVIE